MTFRNSGELQNLEEEKRIFQKELSTWSKKIPLIVGFETVAEALFGQQASYHFLNRTTNVDHPMTDHSNGKLSSTSVEDVSRVNLTSDLESNPGKLPQSTIDSQSESWSNKMEDDDWSFDCPLDLRTPEKMFNESILVTSQSDQNVRQLSVNNDHHLNNNNNNNNNTHFSNNNNNNTHLNNNNNNTHLNNNNNNNNTHFNNNNHVTPSARDAWKLQSLEGNDSPRLKFNREFRSSIDQSRRSGTDQSSNENFRSDLRIGKFQSATKNPAVDQVQLMDRRSVSKQTTFRGSKDGNEDEKKHELGNFPSNWKNESESLDFSRIEKFRNGESSSEETQESPLFRMNENVGHLIMSVIAKNILEKYHQVTNHHDNGVIPEDPLTPPPTMMMMMTSEGQMHSSIDQPLDLATSFPRRDASVETLRNTFQRGHVDIQISQSSSSTDNKWCSLASPNSSSSNLTSAKKSRPKRGQYRRYNRQLLLEAVRAVQQGDMSVHRAGSYFGVPHSTLEYKVKERHLLRNKKSSQDQRLKNGYLGNDKSIPPLSVHSSPSCQIFPLRGLTADVSPTFSKIRKESELATGLRGGTAADPRVGYRYPFYNEVMLRNSMFYSGMFEGFTAPYGWLAPRFTKSPLFPLVYPPHSTMFVPSASEQNGPASDMLRKLNPGVQTDGHVSATSSSSSSSIAASKNTGSGEDSSEPHSTSSFEVDLRVKVTSED